jgi:uncharacterized protein with PIN domain
MAPAFAAENTLGRLATWLRLLGFDTILAAHLPRASWTEGFGPGRIRLTRVRRLAEKEAAVFIAANAPVDQLRELIACKLISRDEIKPFTRCLRCNRLIEAVARESVAGAVPDYVWRTHADFSRCPGCARVYWRGSHTRRGLERIEALFRG